MGQGTDIIVADNIACFINGVLHFYIKQNNTIQNSLAQFADTMVSIFTGWVL